MFVFSTLFLLKSSSVSAQTSTPYGGIPHPIPGIIEVENYDLGGQGVAYYDTSSTNEGGLYRTDRVDISDTPDEGAGGNYRVGWLQSGEWLKYTVNVAKAGSYELRIRGNLEDYQQNNPTQFQIFIDDEPIAGDLASSTFENFYGHFGWRGYSTSPKPTSLPAIVDLKEGQHVIKINISKSGGGGLNYLVFEPANLPPLTTLAYPTTTIGKTYYVSPSGNDTNPGTFSLPWKTLTKAGNMAKAGDTVYVRGGTYNTRLIPQNSGTPENFIIFKAYQGETPIIDGSGISFPQLEGLVNIEGKRYIQVSGLTIKNTNSHWNSGISIDYSNNIIIDNNKIENIYSSGISTSRASHDVLIEKNTLYKTNQGGSDTEVSLGTYWFSYNIDINGNTIYGGGGEGIGVAAGPHHSRVRNNTVHSMGNLRSGIGIYIDSWTERQYAIDVYGNTVRDNPNEGIAVSNEGAGLLSDVRIFNNLVYDTGYGGIGAQMGVTNWSNSEITSATTHPLKNIYLFNNTLSYVDNWVPNTIFINNPEITNVVIKNNIMNTGNCSYTSLGINTDGVCLETFRSVLTGCPSTLNQCRQIIASQLTVSKNYTGSNPGFVNRAGLNFRLSSSSPARDTGDAIIDTLKNISAPSFDFDNLARPAGSGYDIGAFEYGSTPVTITITTTPTSTPLTPGDANGDGKVDGIDYVVWLNNYNQPASPNDNSSGNFNSDSAVDGLDYVIWLNNYTI